MLIRVFLSLLFLAGLSFAQGQSSASTKSAAPTRVVAQVALLDQTEGVTETVLYTPEHDGLFRVSAYAIPTVLPNASCNPADSIPEGLSAALRWTDDGNPVEAFDLLGIAFVLPGTNYDQRTVIVHAKAHTPIRYEVDLNFQPNCTVTEPGHYDLFISLELLF
jgi:hypothetical protein